MVQKLKDNGRFNMALLLAGMSVFCFSLSIIRVFLSGSPRFLFLNWNLFLAFIPWAVTTMLMMNEKYRLKKLVLGPLLLVWAAFFPNAPYVLTDLFHLRLSSTVPVWFDLALILSFAWTSLVYGFVSLMDIETILSSFLHRVVVGLTVIVLLFASGFGVYIGRYLRWNSWDMVSNPFAVATDILDRFIDPFSHPRTWGMTILMGILLNMMYWTIKLITAKRKEGIANL